MTEYSIVSAENPVSARFTASTIRLFWPLLMTADCVGIVSALVVICYIPAMLRGPYSGPALISRDIVQQCKRRQSSTNMRLVLHRP